MLFPKLKKKKRRDRKSEMTNKQFNIRKKIAKHGSNSIIVIPKLLQSELKPKTIVDIEIKVVEEAQEEGK